MNDLDGQLRELFQARARHLAARGRVAERQLADEPIAVFHAGGEQLGLPVSRLRSVIRVPAVTPVPGLPPWLAGVAQVRGTLLSVIHLARWLGAASPAPAPYLALLEQSHQPLGLLVERVAGVREIFVDELLERYAGTAAMSTLPIRQTTRDLVAVVDVARLYELVDRREVKSGIHPHPRAPGASP